MAAVLSSGSIASEGSSPRTTSVRTERLLARSAEVA
jgi:hypothetical protein